MYKIGDLVEVSAHKVFDKVEILNSEQRAESFSSNQLTSVQGYLYCYTAHDQYWLLELLPEFADSGWVPSNDDYDRYSTREGFTYSWVKEKHFIKLVSLPRTYLQCVECTGSSPWASVNLPEGKFVCWACCDSKAWKYKHLLLKSS